MKTEEYFSGADFFELSKRRSVVDRLLSAAKLIVNKNCGHSVPFKLILVSVSRLRSSHIYALDAYVLYNSAEI